MQQWKGCGVTIKERIMYKCMFFQKTIDNVDALFQYLDEIGNNGDWIFKGLHSEWNLKNTLERVLIKAGIKDREGYPKIEKEIIREFQRLYKGKDLYRVRNDTLYCLSVMQHHGAPTRLLDFTYSIYIALYFALEYATDNRPVSSANTGLAIWCINTKWLIDHPTSINIFGLMERYFFDECRDEESFHRIYMGNQYTFVGLENPVQINQRLHLQQGLFLCTGNIRKSFEDNICEFEGWQKQSNIQKVICRVPIGDVQKALEKCRRMNVSRETLFPGLDGFAQSMKYNLLHYKRQAESRIG